MKAVADSIRLADDLRAARTKWLESHGVPISFDFANFAEMVGAAEAYLRLPAVAAAPELLEALQNVYNYLIGLHAYLLSCETSVIVENLESTSGFAYKTAELCDAAIRKAKGEA